MEIVSLLQEVSGISGEVSLQAFLSFASSLGICHRLLSGTGRLPSMTRQVGCPRNSLSLAQIQHPTSKITIFPELICSSLLGGKLSVQNFA